MQYTAEIFGHSWKQGPRVKVRTITEGRAFAESYGSTADSCTITRGRRVVARHVRNPNGNGLDWFRA